MPNGVFLSNEGQGCIKAEDKVTYITKQVAKIKVFWSSRSLLRIVLVERNSTISFDNQTKQL